MIGYEGTIFSYPFRQPTNNPITEEKEKFDAEQEVSQQGSETLIHM
jgi:hypothetical protein